MASAPAQPTVTVAIAAFNSAEFIASSIASALRQTLTDIEVIVVDDCSSDDTVAIARAIAEQDARVRIERLSINQGPAAARNTALEMARGQWFAVLDSDDLYAPDRLQRLLAIAEARGADIVADNMVVFADDPGDSTHHHLSQPFVGRWIEPDDYFAQTRMFGGGLDYGYLKPMLRLDRLRAAGLRYDETLRIGEDDDLIARMLLEGMRYWLDPSPTYCYRRHAGSISFRLSSTNARALARSAAQLVAAHSQARFAPALRRRHRAFIRALAFVEFIDDLKRRQWRTALVRALTNPAMLPLLRMPLRGRLDRVLASLSSGRSSTPMLR